MAIDPMTSYEQAEAEADERFYEEREDRACPQTVPEVCDHGPVVTRRDGKLAGSPWDKDK